MRAVLPWQQMLTTTGLSCRSFLLAMACSCRRMLEMLGTRFRSWELEQQYREFRASTYFLRADVPFTLVSTAMLSVLAAHEVERNGLTTATFGSLLLVGFAAAQLLLIFLADKDSSGSRLQSNFLRQRTFLVLLLRGVLLPAFTALGVLNSEPNMTRPQSFLSHLLMATGVVPLLLTSLAMPLLLEHHVPVQAVVAIFMGLYIGPRFCTEAARNSHAAAYILEHRALLARGASDIVGAMYLRSVQEASETEPLQACLLLMTFFYVFLGVVAPTYIIWLLEYSSRFNYLESKGILGDQQCGCWSPIGWVHVTYHAVLLVVSFAVAWHGLTDAFLSEDLRCDIELNPAAKGRVCASSEEL